ncbi:MAG: hypothetical protein MAG431_01973 [Chloroflexi bacterium]|nr:hypothetical protein [Chloroflexota bacterium]
MTQNLHVHILRPFEGDAMRLWEDSLAGNIYYTAGDEIPDPAHYQILIAGRPPRKFLEASPHLKAVIIPWAGVPGSTRELLDDFPHE